MKNTVTLDKHIIKSNIKKNFIFVISATAFLCLNIRLLVSNLIGLIVAVIFIFLIFTQISNFYNKIKQSKILTKIIAVITSIGICFRSKYIFYNFLNKSSSLENLLVKLNINKTIILNIVSILGAVLAFIIVFSLIVIESIEKVV